MYTFLVVLLVLVSVALIGVVLIQSGKGDGLSGAFGMGEGQAVFGSRAGDVLTKATTWFAVAFMILCLGVTYMSNHEGDSMLSLGRISYSSSRGPSGEKPLTLEQVESNATNASGASASGTNTTAAGTNTAAARSGAPAVAGQVSTNK